MSRVVVAIAVLVFLSACGVDTTRTQPPVTEIRATTCDGDIQTAIGSLMAPNLMLTVAHVFDETSSFEIVDTAFEQAELVYLDTDRDIAIIKTSNPASQLLDFGAAETGDEVQLQLRMNNPAATVIDKSKVSFEGRPTIEALQIDVAPTEGQSGALLVKSETVVGMVFAASADQRSGWAIATTELEDALSQAKEQLSDNFTRPTLGCR